VSRKVFLNIADYIILIQTYIPGLDLLLDETYIHWKICPTTRTDMIIEVIDQEEKLPDNASLIFYAPLPGSNEKNINQKKHLWAMYKSEMYYHITGMISEKVCNNSFQIKFNPCKSYWQLIIPKNSNSVNPLQHPIGSLILYYLTQNNNSFLMHAAGLRYHNLGFVFSGKSGSGKSTLANLFKYTGADIINDDRIIIRIINGKAHIYNSPVYQNDFQKRCRLSAIFHIEHREKNNLRKLGLNESISYSMANTIQHNYSPDIIIKQIKSISKCISPIPHYKLGFLPEKEIVEYILSRLSNV